MLQSILGWCGRRPYDAGCSNAKLIADRLECLLQPLELVGGSVERVVVQELLERVSWLVLEREHSLLFVSRVVHHAFDESPSHHGAGLTAEHEPELVFIANDLGGFIRAPKPFRELLFALLSDGVDLLRCSSTRCVVVDLDGDATLFQERFEVRVDLPIGLVPEVDPGLIDVSFDVVACPWLLG